MRTQYTSKITKRSLKNFTQTKWSERLSKKNWASKENEDLDTMVEIFTSNIQETMDEIAPYRNFTVKTMKPNSKINHIVFLPAFSKMEN